MEVVPDRQERLEADGLPRNGAPMDATNESLLLEFGQIASDCLRGDPEAGGEF